MPLTVAVTGASGFIGRHVVQRLLADGLEVRALGRSADLREAFRGAGAVVHLAGFAHGGPNPPVDPVRVNVEIARATFEAAAAERVPRFINMSSVGAVVARSDTVVSDSTPFGDVSRYGLSKREVELYLDQQRGDNIQVAHLRPPAVYGPGMRGKSATLFKLVKLGVPLPLGGISNSRSFMYVGNLVSAVSMLLNSPHASGAFVVSDSAPVSTPEFARRIAAALGKPSRIFTLPRAIMGFVRTLDELHASLPIDSTRFWQAVGGQPQFSMEEGLRVTTHAA